MKSLQQRPFHGRMKRQKLEKSQLVLHKNIPQDVILDEILTRLPVESILRFKAVSKLWYSTISNPSFRRRRPATLIFAMDYSFSKNNGFYSIDEKGGVQEFRVPGKTVPVEYPYQLDCSKEAAISNSCNGMMLSRVGSGIYLLNPSTRYIDRVLTLETVDKTTFCTRKIGFCYDESIGDYKAVVFIIDLGGYSARVASLKQKKWTNVYIPMNFRGMLMGPLLNDRLHSTVCVSDDYRKSNHNTIVNFNPIKIVFENVPCPQPKSGDEDAILGLGVLEGCLCMARKIGEKNVRGEVEVLKMKEYGVAESWTSLFVSKDVEQMTSDTCGWFDPLTMTDDGDFLYRNHDKIWRYNLEEKTYTNIMPNWNMNLAAAVTFEENLYPPENGYFLERKYSSEHGDNYSRNIASSVTSRDCSSSRRSDSGCYKCGKQGHFARDCSRGGGGGSKRRSRSERLGSRGGRGGCYNCGKPGHLAKDCRF